MVARGGCAIVVLMLATSIPDIWRTISLTLAQEDDSGNEDEAQILEAVDQRMTTFRNEIDGRSVFFVPRRPDPPPPPVVERRDTEDRPPSVPTRYGGPAVVAMMNGAVWFANGERLEPGQEAAGVRVIETKAPWSVRLEWSGGEFDVDLFRRDGVVFPKKEEDA
ncbi:MAG: hypothetical protein KDA28_03410 [Phycisphaerales bacterium]|nr:hypothetical protein [Phycisphaerales bacterium]